MAISLIQHRVAQTVASQLTVAIAGFTATTIGSLLVVCCGNAGTRTVVSVTDDATGGSNTYIPAAAAAGVDGAHGSEIWYCLNAPRGGATTVTVTFSGVAGTFNKEAWLFEVSGFSNATLDVANNVSNGAGAANVDTGASVTTTSAVGFIAAVIITSNNVTENPRTGNEFTSGGDSSAVADAACSLISTTAAAHTPVWTDGFATPNFSASTAAFKESSGAAPAIALDYTPGAGGTCIPSGTAVAY